MANPYDNIPDYCFWSRAVSRVPLGHIDVITPLSKASIIGRTEKVSTIGSCFAQHLSRRIKQSGLNYFIAEDSADLSPEDYIKKNYGVFSARYGNVYTIRQALQLFDRAFGNLNPINNVWEKGNLFVDRFRPQIEPNGFETVEQLNTSMDVHLSCVKRVFIESDWLIFTMGLTEAWRCKQDGSIYPTAPEVAGGKYDPLLYEFVNFTVKEMKQDFVEFMEKIKSVNPKLKIILTVSPVPMIATYENRHVLVSNSYSKSALRVVADEMEKEYDNIIYFPSFDIATSSATEGRYYHDNLREITPLGLNHVMRLFAKYFIENTNDSPAIDNTVSNSENVVCDEEAIENMIKQNK